MMKNAFLCRMILIMLAYIFVLPLYAADNSSDFVNLLDSVKTMQANFTQTVYDNSGKSVQTSYGHMAMQRPGKFRWEVKKPIPQLIIANESKLWIYDPDLQQLTIRSLSKTSGGTPALLLSHVNSSIDKDFSVQPLSKKISGSWFKLIPKQKDNMFSFIEMGFEGKHIQEMRLEDHLGHHTLIKFTGASINTPLSNSLFILKAPANADVIDETKRH